MNQTRKVTPTRPAVRCAIYTRKSTEEGLEQEFNTLDAQRECSESFICGRFRGRRLGAGLGRRHEGFLLGGGLLGGCRDRRLFGLRFCGRRIIGIKELVRPARQRIAVPGHLFDVVPFDLHGGAVGPHDEPHDAVLRAAYSAADLQRRQVAARGGLGVLLARDVDSPCFPAVSRRRCDVRRPTGSLTYLSRRDDIKPIRSRFSNFSGDLRPFGSVLCGEPITGSPRTEESSYSGGERVVPTDQAATGCAA
jgi:hypothetical protein